MSHDKKADAEAKFDLAVQNGQADIGSSPSANRTETSCARCLATMPKGAGKSLLWWIYNHRKSVIRYICETCWNSIRGE
jgi:hypothetical protein